MSKKVVYLVTSAASILAAAIVKMNDESTEFEASTSADEVGDLKAIWDENNPVIDGRPGKKFPVSIKIDEDGELIDDESPLAIGIELSAYDVNNGDHFHTLMGVINGDPQIIKTLTDKGDVILEAHSHKAKIKELTGAETNEDIYNIEDEPKSPVEDVPPVEPPVVEPPAPVEPPVIQVPADSVIEPPVVESETNTVNSETEQAKEDAPAEGDAADGEADKKTAKK